MATRRKLPVDMILLVLLTLAVYLPIMLYGSFIWDDDLWLTDNLLLRQPDGLWQIWFNRDAFPQYYPVVLSSFFTELRLYGLNPHGYILVNVFLHAASGCFLYAILRRLSVPGALLGAVLFAVHPMNLESVAWITERKNCFAGFFMLAAMLVYVSFSPTSDMSRRRRIAAYACATVLFALALLSKSVSCVLPPALLVIAWWKQKKFPYRDLYWLLPWFAMGMIAGLNTAFMERTHVGAVGDDFAFTLVDRLLIIGRNWWFYPGKVLWPDPLIFFYRRWTIDSAQLWQFIFPASVLAVFAVLYFFRKRWGYAPLVVAALYSIGIFPALGFFNVFPFRYSWVADHFAYLALMPLFAGIAALAMLARERLRIPARAGTALAAAVVIALGVIAANRGNAYRGWLPMFEDTVKKNPDNDSVWSLYGHSLLKAGKFTEARFALEKAYSLSKNQGGYFGPLALACIQLGQYDDAERYLNLFVTASPNNSYAYHVMGILRSRQQRREEAYAMFIKAYQMEPTRGRSIINAGITAMELGQFQNAIECYRIAIQLNPMWAMAHDLLGRALAASGDLQSALPHFEKASELEANPEYRTDLERARQLLSSQKTTVSQTQPGNP